MISAVEVGCVDPHVREASGHVRLVAELIQRVLSVWINLLDGQRHAQLLHVGDEGVEDVGRGRVLAMFSRKTRSKFPA